MRQFLRNRVLFNFNQLERDAWIRSQAALVAPGSRVLDVGAGTCIYKDLFSHCDYKTQDFEGLGSQSPWGAYGHIDYRCDAAAIPVESASFDVVVCTEVLEHVPEPIRVVREMARVLKPAGRLILTAPLGSGLHQEPFHFYGGYTPHWYRKFLGEAGFSDVSVAANGGFFKHYSQESIRFVRLTSPWNIRMNVLLRLLWVLPWLLLVPWLAIFVPVLCHLLDGTDKDKSFTVGYHVTALRSLK